MKKKKILEYLVKSAIYQNEVVEILLKESNTNRTVNPDKPKPPKT